MKKRTLITIQVFSFAVCFSIVLMKKLDIKTGYLTDKTEQNKQIPIRAMKPEQEKRFASK